MFNFYLIFFKLCLYLSILSIKVFSDNIDTEFPITFIHKRSGSVPKLNKQSLGSYFGLSVNVNQENDINYVLIGAPTFKSHNGIERSGAIFHCQWKESDSQRDVMCTQIDVTEARSINWLDTTDITNNMLLGTSLTSNRSSFVGCAHAWAYDIRSRERLPTPIGKCYTFNNTGHALNSFEPLVFGKPSKWDPKGHSRLMFGFSSTFDNSGKELVLGSPGYYYFKGTIIKESNNREDLMELDKWLNSTDKRLPTLNSYLGYSVTTCIYTEQQEYIVMSAPRNNIFYGKVYLFPLNELFEKDKINEYLLTIEGSRSDKGEYFGASLLALDINNDKIDDLIVGAPFYSNQQNREIGRIYVFFNKKGFSEVNQLIYGYKSAGRFGTALSSIDINLDGYKDAIIGAPHELNSDGSSGALYIYLGSAQGLDLNPYKRIGAEDVKSVSLKGFGISIVSNTDFDKNGYNDLLIGSHLSEHALLIRTKPIAILNTSITLKPSRILLHQMNCNNNKSSCFNVEYCVSYDGKYIRDKQSAFVTLEIIDSKLSIKESRVTINAKKIELKNIELRVNRKNCFTAKNSFHLMVNKLESLIDIITPIEIKLSVELKNDSSNAFCKNCPYAQSYSTITNIDFEHECQTRICLSHLNLTAISSYSGERIVKNLIEGQHDNIDIEINVVNSGETSLKTILTIQMKPFLNLTKTSDTKKCKADTNSSSYTCLVSQILLKGKQDNLKLHFLVSRILTNNIEIDFLINSSSSLHTASKLSQTIKLEIIRKANIQILSESVYNVSFSEKTPKVLFLVPYSLIKSGPSTISSAFLQILLPVDVVELENESKQICKTNSVGNSRNYFPIENGIINLVCDENSKYCTKYLCEMPKFNSGNHSERFTLSLALIPSKIKNKDYNGINLKLNSEVKIEDNRKFESNISSSESLDIYFAQKEPINGKRIEKWVLFLSAGIGIFVLIITLIILIKYGFFRRKKREELLRVKQRMSIKPDSYDINNLDTNTSDSNNDLMT